MRELRTSLKEQKEQNCTCAETSEDREQYP